LFDLPDVVSFEVHDEPRDIQWYGRRDGVVGPDLHWTMELAAGSETEAVPAIEAYE
jgi:hypothetical protein